MAVLTEQRHGRAFIAAPVLIGCGAVLWYGASAEPSLAGLLAGLLVPLAVYLRNRQRHPVLAAAAFAVALAAFGALLSAFEAQRAGTVLLDGPVTTEITGTVAGREAMGEGTFRYVLRLTDTRNPHLARPPDRVAVVARHSQPFPFGSTMEGTARLSPPSGPALPGLTDFSLGAYLSGIGANGFFYGPPRAVTGETRLEPGLADRAFEALARLRAGVGDRIRPVIPGDAGAFAAAIVTNEQRAISKRTMENLRLSGLAHVVAISGMNMVLAAGLFFVGLRTLFSLAVGFNQGVPTRKLAAVAALAGTIAYYMISGFAVSAERAFIMMVVMLIAVLADRPAFSLRNVALSALLIEAVTPSAVMTPSFQMSFAGTIGLVAGYEAWARRKSKKLAAGPPKHGPAAIPGMLWSAVAATVASSVIGTLSTALFSLEHFQRLALAGVVANLIATPLIGIVVMPMALLAVVLMPFGLDRLPLVAMGKGVEGVLAIGDRVADWGGEWLSGILPGWFIALAVASFLTLCLLRTRLRLLALPVLGLALLLLAMRPGPRMPDLLVAEDGQTAALVTGAGLALTDGTSRFVTDQWQRALRLGQSMPPIFHEPGDGMRADQRDDRYRPLTDLRDQRARRDGHHHRPCRDRPLPLQETRLVPGPAARWRYRRHRSEPHLCRASLRCSRYRRGPGLPHHGGLPLRRAFRGPAGAGLDRRTDVHGDP